MTSDECRLTNVESGCRPSCFISCVTRHPSFETFRLQKSQVKTAQDHCDREEDDRKDGRVTKIIEAKSGLVDIPAYSFRGEPGSSLGEDEDLVEDAEQIHGPQ